jgi:hypothetical protein
MPPLRWERLESPSDDPGSGLSVFRAAVPGGWLVCCQTGGGVAFLPDPWHRWHGGSAPVGER